MDEIIFGEFTKTGEDTYVATVTVRTQRPTLSTARVIASLGQERAAELRDRLDAEYAAAREEFAPAVQDGPA